MVRSRHATPVDALDIHKDLQSQHSFAIHFGTFAGSQEEVGGQRVDVSG